MEEKDERDKEKEVGKGFDSYHLHVSLNLT